METRMEMEMEMEAEQGGGTRGSAEAGERDEGMRR